MSAVSQDAGATGANASRPSQLYAEDFAIGQRFSGQHIVLGDEQFRLFATLTGDRHPIHYDDDYASRSRFGKRLAHGLLVTSMTALGATPLSDRLEESMVAFLEQRTRYLAPVLVGERITTGFVVESVKLNAAKKTGVVGFAIDVLNDRDEPVAEGCHHYLLRMRGQGGK